MSYENKYLQIVACLSDRDNRLLSCDIARLVLTEFKVEDPRSWEAVEVSTRYADGLATEAELFAAGVAAWDAAEDAALSAAWAAVGAVMGSARYAARAAAVAAGVAAGGSDWAAADVARAAEDDAYKLFFEWALELAIGEEVPA